VVKQKRQLDAIDWRLVRALSADGRQTLRALAQEVELSEPAVRDRVQRLEHDGVVTSYRAVIDPAAVSRAAAAFVAIRFDVRERSAVLKALLADTDVLEAHEVAGDDCCLLKLRVASTDALAEALERIRAMRSVSGTRTTVVLRTLFERPLAVIDPAEPGEPPRG